MYVSGFLVGILWWASPTAPQPSSSLDLTHHPDCLHSRTWCGHPGGRIPTSSCSKKLAATPTDPVPPTHTSCLAGDGAGILVGIPHIFLSEVADRECGIKLPPQVRQAAGMPVRWAAL